MMEDVDLGLKISATLPLAIVDFIVMVIKLVIMEEVGIDIKRPATITLAIVEKVLIVMGEVDIGLRTATLPPITQLDVVDCWVSHFLLVLLTKMFTLMIEVGIGLRPDNITTINQVGLAPGLAIRSATFVINGFAMTTTF